MALFPFGSHSINLRNEILRPLDEFSVLISRRMEALLDYAQGYARCCNGSGSAKCNKAPFYTYAEIWVHDRLLKPRRWMNCVAAEPKHLFEIVTQYSPAWMSDLEGSNKGLTDIAPDATMTARFTDDAGLHWQIDHDLHLEKLDSRDDW
jgi:hypothetical protein